MGFSSALLGRVAHEALVVRQDAELRLMDTMKRSMQLKAKCDREYAISLAAVAQQGLKIDRADELQGSLITKSWRSYMDELDLQAKQLKTNAEQLEVVCDKLTHLSQDKRKARKTYQEEHAKIAARLNHLTDEVVRKKAEYQKHLEGYKALRTRFEEHYIKSGRGGRKLDDVRDKYQKACRKLHLTHNEYVLSITEAVEVEKDFRSVLLPGLLEHQQSVQESFVLLWKNILQEASQHGDLTSDKFREIQKRIDSVINNINPSEEYREFTEKHKQASPTTPLIFQFDESLIEDIPGKLQSNTLTVDNLTVDWLRSRLIDLEQSVKECQEKQIKMIEHVNGGSPIANGTPLSNGNGHGHTNSIQSNKDYQSRQSKDLSALRCQEKQKQKLVDMIKCALNEVGCEELPSGCDDHLTLEQNFIENGFNNDQQGSSNGVSILNELRRRGGVLTLWRGRHFKRKSTPQPTTPTVSRLHPPRLDTLKPRSQSLGSLSVNSSPARYEPITNYPLRMAASVEAATGPGRRRQLNAVELMDVELAMAFTNGGSPLALRRFQRSMLCVAEESLPPSAAPATAADAVAIDQPAGVAAAVATNEPACSNPLTAPPNNNNNNNKNNNNNNIYTDLVLGGEHGDGESVKSGELAMRQVRNVEIEINWKEVQAQAAKAESEAGQATSEGASDCPPAQPPPLPLPNATCSKLQQEEEPTKNSIDAHLDKIDELNRALDDRLKRNITQQTIMDLDAIEAVDSVVVVTRPKSKAEDKNGSKRTSSSSSDCHAYLSRKTNDSEGAPTEGKGSKKRSMSFSQKSINALICNLKEFSRSPLARMHKHHGGGSGAAPVTVTSYTQTLPEDEEDVRRVESAIEENIPQREEVASAMISEGPSGPLTGSAKKHSKEAAKADKVKFKMPKIQKKSKGIRQTFRTKLLNFQMKRNNNQKLCKTCTKRRRIHPSKSVFDFAKEFNLPEQPISLPAADGDGSGSDDECVEFCTCPHEAPARLTVANSDYQKRASSSSMDAEDEGDSSDDAAGGGRVAKEPCYCIPSLATSISLSTNRPLYEEEWFHGVLPREEVVRLLNNDGDFLVRETIRNEESQIVLSVCWNGHKHFIVQTTGDGHFLFEGLPFPSIQELIMDLHHTKMPVTVKSGAILKRPICRERWELSNDDVVLLDKIGRGNFGDVYKAKLKPTNLDVAVKTCRITLPDEQKRKFLQEGRILKQYDHPNIVKLIGICVQKQPIMIVMELVPGGSLLNYLRKNSNNLTTRQQMTMCRDASAGMRYLESKNCIHRDLAARNCLVDFENYVKISDFGMSREEEEYIVSDGMKQIPVKWTAPEALNFGKYTTLCDVWSYGILMWEIFSKGDTPYSGMSNSRARERIDAGYRMPAPENTPPEMYRLMLKCWAADAESRPHFDEIYNVVDALIHRLESCH